jgi:hypothetical protein
MIELKIPCLSSSGIRPILEDMRGTATPFGDYSRYTTAELIEAYRQGANRLRIVLAGLSEDELLARPRGEGKWSAQEIVIHVMDSEVQGVFRIRKAWAEPGAEWPGYNQDAWTAAIGHQSAGPDQRELAIQVFDLLRKATLPIFERATASDWTSRHGVHPEFGPLTLRQLLELYADHSERHVEHILTIRNLIGRPLELPSLLPYRLY